MDKFEAAQIQAEILQSWPREAQEYIMVLQTYLQKVSVHGVAKRVGVGVLNGSVRTQVTAVFC
jgi:hypothetical protein